MYEYWERFICVQMFLESSALYIGIIFCQTVYINMQKKVDQFDYY